MIDFKEKIKDYKECIGFFFFFNRIFYSLIFFFKIYSESMKKIHVLQL